jgi:hypothetical protein
VVGASRSSSERSTARSVSFNGCVVSIVRITSPR